MRLVFAGSGEFALPVLAALAASPHAVALVLTRPDRPAGRGRRLSPTPVRRWAELHGLQVATPGTLAEPAVEERIRAEAPDALVVVDYGGRVPASLLALPRYGGINVHPSLLPRWRGAAPIERAVAAGDRETGVAIMQMDAGIDTGPVLGMERTAIGAGETAGELSLRLAERGSRLLLAVLDRLVQGGIAPRAQAGEATPAPRVTTAEARLDFALPAAMLARRILAFNPRPGAWAECGGERVRLLRAVALAQPDLRDEPGRVLAAGKAGLDVATGSGLLRVTEAQRPGGRALAGAALAQSRRWTTLRLR